jgi:hypothetical protein
MIHPTIHLNGTSRNELLEQWGNAYHALADARKALYDAQPNGRDYYPQGPDAITAATVDHIARLEAIESVMDEIDALREKAYE